MKTFASYVLMVVLLFFAIARVVQRHIIQLVLSGMRHFSAPKLNGTVVGMFVVYVKRLPTICAILVHIRCAKDVQKMLISSVFEEAKAFAQHA